MKVLSVIPLTKGIPHEELTYFSKENIDVGDLVDITIRNRTCRALVISENNLNDVKQNIKNSSFSLKKIKSLNTKQLIPKEIINVIYFLSSFFIRNPGVILYDLISEKAFDTDWSIKKSKEKEAEKLMVLEESYINRTTRYRTTIRENFSKKKSVVIFLPTINEINHIKEDLDKGIEKYVFELHSDLTESKYKKNLTEIIKSDHPILILSTPSIVPFIREDLGLVVLEKESSDYYFKYGEESYDTRMVLRKIATSLSIPILLGSHMLSTYTRLKHKRREADEIMPLHLRNDTELLISSFPKEGNKNKFLTQESIKKIKTLIEEKRGHLFLYVQRKGMFPSTVCSDCGTVFTCDKCDKPYVIHKINNERTFVCHKCESTLKIDKENEIACRYCGGWRLTNIGIASLSLFEHLKDIDAPIFLLDKDVGETRSKANKIIKGWENSPYGILIGTEMALNSIKRCDGAIVISIDSLFSLPEYRTDEKIIHLLNELADKIDKKEGNYGLTLQTRMNKLPIIKYLERSSWKETFEDILKERDDLLLPPYYTVIKALVKVKDKSEIKIIEDDLKDYVTEWFYKGNNESLLFIHIREDVWEKDTKLRDKIKSTLTLFSKEISVNPINLFS